MRRLTPDIYMDVGQSQQESNIKFAHVNAMFLLGSWAVTRRPDYNPLCLIRRNASPPISGISVRVQTVGVLSDVGRWIGNLVLIRLAGGVRDT